MLQRANARLLIVAIGGVRHQLFGNFGIKERLFPHGGVGRLLVSWQVLLLLHIPGQVVLLVILEDALPADLVIPYFVVRVHHIVQVVLHLF